MSILFDYDYYKENKLSDMKKYEQNKYNMYEEVNIKNLDKNKQILICKEYNIFILIKDTFSGIKLHLSDYDIIKVFINLYNEKRKIYEYIMQALDNIYNINGSDFEFKFINRKYKFEKIGMPFYHEKFCFNTKADIEIDINEFIAIINLVLIKEYVSKEGENALKGTINKYRYIVKYELFKSEDLRIILEKNNYIVDKTLEENYNLITSYGKNRMLVYV